MEPAPARTLRDLAVATRRWWPILAVGAVLGLLGGFVVRPSGGHPTATQTILLADPQPTASALGLPLGSALDTLPSHVAAEMKERITSLADLDKATTVSFQADDTARTLEVTVAASDAADQATRIAQAVLDDLQSRQETRLTAATDYHRARTEEIDSNLSSSTSDTDRSVLIVERARHLDAIGSLAQLSGSPLGELIASERSAKPGQGGGAAIAAILAGTILGACAGLLAVYVRVLGDRMVRTAADIRSTTGSEVLAVVPRAAAVAGTAAAYTVLAGALLHRHSGSTVLVVAADDSVDTSAVAAGLHRALDGLGAQSKLSVETGSPLSSGADAVRSATQADGTILVARSGHTHADTLRAATQMLTTAGGTTFGAVLVDVPVRELAWAAANPPTR